MEIGSFNDILLLSIAFISIILQCYIILVIVVASPSGMASYRYFLCLITIWDMLFTSLVAFGLEPKLLFPMSAALIHGLFKEGGLDVVRSGMCAIVFCAVQVLAAQLNCLLYRLTLVIPNRKIHDIFILPTCKLVVQAVFVGIGFFFSVPAFNYFCNELQVFNYIQGWKNWYAKEFNNTEIIPENSIVLAMDFGLPNTNVIFMAKIIVIGLCAAEVICFVIVFIIIKVLKANAHNFSKKSYRIHKQLIILLIVQLILPMFFIVLPVGCAVTAALIGHGLDKNTGDIGIIILTLYATSNSLLTIFFVTPYRWFTRRRLESCFFALVTGITRLRKPTDTEVSKLSNRCNVCPILT